MYLNFQELLNLLPCFYFLECKTLRGSGSPTLSSNQLVLLHLRDYIHSIEPIVYTCDVDGKTTDPKIKSFIRENNYYEKLYLKKISYSRTVNFFCTEKIKNSKIHFLLTHQ